MANLTVNLTLPSDGIHPIPQVAQSMSGINAPTFVHLERVIHVKALSVILDEQVQPPILNSHPQPDLVGTSVPDDIVQDLFDC